MHAETNFWRTARGPLLIILLAVLGVITATVLDAYHSEWSLTIGATSLGMLLPVGVIWLLLGRYINR